jgi:hypothetical protein
MRRTSQLVGLDFSTGRSISLLPVMASVAKARLIFMTFREPAEHAVELRNAFIPPWSRGYSCQLGNMDVVCLSKTSLFNTFIQVYGVAPELAKSPVFVP